MAYTQEQIDGARAWATGKTGAEIQSKAQELGLDSSTLGTVLGYTPSQVASSGYGSSTGFTSDVASSTWGGYTAPSSAPAPATGLTSSTTGATSSTPTFNLAGIASRDPRTPDYMGRQFSDKSIADAKTWAQGKSLSEVLAKAGSMGLTPDQVGLVLGTTGKDVLTYTGYGQGANAFNADGSLNYQWGWNDDPTQVSNGEKFANAYLVNGFGSEQNPWGAVSLDSFTVGANGINGPVSATVRPNGPAGDVQSGGATPTQTPQAFTTQNIVDAYNEALTGGKTEAEFVTEAKRRGVSDTQLADAQMQIKRTAASKFTPQNIADAYRQSVGTGAGQTTEAEFVKYALAQGFTQEQLTAARALLMGTSATPTTPVVPTTPGTSPIASSPIASSPFLNASGLPTTGINLSQLQNAQQWQVQPNQTVQDQLQQIIANDSPLMQQARARALQQANERGLLNSSMAVTAGQSAVLDAAMPIAQQDASTFADAAKFNTGEVNTFARDNNAFTRDAFMADFNLAANEWAKTQDQYRLFDQMGYQQKLTLDRDAIQNGYQSARDAILNGYTVARDAATNAFTLQRDATQNEFTATQNQLEREAAMARQQVSAAAGQSTDTSVDRTLLQINADKDRTLLQINADKDHNALKVQLDARDTITNARSTLNSQLIEIEGMPGLDTATKNTMMNRAINNYSTIVSGHLADSGWSGNTWAWNPSDSPPAAATATTGTTTGETVKETP